MIKNTPAVTIVAACINADTGVGPSIALGNHICNPTCADLPAAPIKIRIPITVIVWILCPNIIIVAVSCMYGTIGNIVLNSNVPKVIYNTNIAIAIATSPTLFTTIANIADLFACNLVNQKLINKYEHNPTPSHPINNCNILSDVTNINIKNVNNDKYDINLGTCGSPFM
jgi:hypothetical protein